MSLHTADPRSYLGYLCDRVASMQVGQCLTVDMREMQDNISGYEHNGADFTPADRVLGNIIGSAWTHSYAVDPMGRNVTFRRHEDTGERRYTDPDRRAAS